MAIIHYHPGTWNETLLGETLNEDFENQIYFQCEVIYTKSSRTAMYCLLRFFYNIFIELGICCSCDLLQGIKSALIHLINYVFVFFQDVFNITNVINFAVNFVLYCAINVHFRNTIKQTLCCRKKKNEVFKFTNITTVVNMSENEG